MAGRNPNLLRTCGDRDGYCGCGASGDRAQSQKGKAVFRNEESREVRTPDYYLSEVKLLKEREKTPAADFRCRGVFSLCVL